MERCYIKPLKIGLKITWEIHLAHAVTTCWSSATACTQLAMGPPGRKHQCLKKAQPLQVGWMADRRERGHLGKFQHFLCVCQDTFPGAVVTPAMVEVLLFYVWAGTLPFIWGAHITSLTSLTTYRPGGDIQAGRATVPPANI